MRGRGEKKAVYKTDTGYKNALRPIWLTPKTGQKVWRKMRGRARGEKSGDSKRRGDEKKEAGHASYRFFTKEPKYPNSFSFLNLSRATMYLFDKSRV